MYKEPIRFYTVGLPRTRSVWLSFLLRFGPAMCFHERLGHGFQIPKELEIAGSCETDFRLDFGNEKLVVVKRDPDEVVDSIINQFSTNKEDTKKAVYKLNTAMDNHLDKPTTFELDYNDMSDVGIMKEACDFLLPDLIPTDWIEYMNDCNIQTENRDITRYMSKEHLEELCA